MKIKLENLPTAIFSTGFFYLLCCGNFNAGTQAIAQDSEDFSTAVENVAKTVGPSVVAIRTQTTERYQARRNYSRNPIEDEFFNQFFGDLPPDFFGAPPDYQYKRAGLGSGVIIDKKGYILTNEHVVEGADQIEVTLPDGRNFKGIIKGIDQNSDLAVVKIEAPDLPVAQLGNSENLKIGQWVVALGNPYGNILSDPSPTLTAGVISALHRALPRTSMRDTDYSDLIQTDAAINPGNSGGPLVNLSGAVVGINVAIFSTTGGYQGIGFAIPINYAKNFVNQIIQGQPAAYGWLGLSLQDLNTQLAKYFGLSTLDGALVVKVLEGAPAQRAGIKDGDIVLSVNDVKIHNSTGLVKYIGQAAIGKEISVNILRDGKKLTIAMVIEKRPELSKLTPQAKQPEEKKSTTPLRNEWRGLRVRDIPETMSKKLNMENLKGVFISDVAPNSPAAAAGLRPRDVIVSINRTPIESVGNFNSAIANTSGNALVRTLRGYFVVEE